MMVMEKFDSCLFFYLISRVITREADLVTAHEFGHNWGSEHHPDVPECSLSAGFSAEG